MRPAGPVIGVLALQGDVPEHLRALEAVGGRPVPVRRPEELGQIDGLVIPGGESTTLWRLSVAFDMLDPLRKLIASGLPALRGPRAVPPRVALRKTRQPAPDPDAPDPGTPDLEE